MDPINQKERTNSFMQFLLLYVLSIAFVVIGIFFNTKFTDKENVKLRTDNKKFEQLSLINTKFSELNKMLLKMDDMDNTDWERSKDNMNDILKDIKSFDKDQGELFRLGVCIDSTFNIAIYDKKNFIANKNSSDKIKELQAQLKASEKAKNDLDRDYKDLEDKYRKLNRIE